MIPVRSRPALELRCAGFRGLLALSVFLLIATSTRAAAEERYALIISGAAGGEKFAESQKKWVALLQSTLQKSYGFAPDRITVLSDEGSAATKENVTRTLNTLKPRLTADDTLIVVLIGHGTYDGAAAKFNLVGPDMDSKEWDAALQGVPGRLVFVNTTSSSFPFVQALAGKNRIIIAATDSVAQKYATVFPQYFIEALEQQEKADNDRNGRLSVWEAFTYAGQAVKQSFDQKGTLVTERAVIDDGSNGVLAKTTFLDPPPAATSDNAEIAALEKRRIAIETEIEQLKARKGQMPAGQYEEEFERLAIELAKISAQIRSAGKE
jgi:hypothetical protein